MQVSRKILFVALSMFLWCGTHAMAAAAATPEARAKTAEKIDLNSATEEQLKELPGVGDTYAKKIVANRPYNSVDDLSAKAGLPQSLITKISPQVTFKKDVAAKQGRATPARRQTVASHANGKSAPSANGKSEPASKVDINTASSDELEALPGIGPVNAKKIIDNRPYNSVNDLSKSGIAASTLDKLRPMVTAEAAPAARRNTPSRPIPTSQRPATAPSPRAEPSTPAATPKSNGSKAPATNDQVWLNTESNIYHRSGDLWYGKTKSGKYVSEEEAIQQGARESKH